MTNAHMQHGEIAELLPWDSDFFNLRIARSTSSAANAQDLRQWSVNHDIDLLYHLADLDAAGANALSAAQFCFVDLQVLFDITISTARDIARPTPGPTAFVRPASSDDIVTLLPLARTAHRDSRFFVDPHLPADRCKDLFGTWLHNSFHGFADVVLVAEDEGQPCGYVTVSKAERKTTIGLIGVSEAHRGKGIGRALVNAAIQWCHQAQIDTMEVITQGQNIAAQRLYQSVGMKTRSMKPWFHLWP